MERIDRLVAVLRAQPFSGIAPDGDGRLHRVTSSAPSLFALMIAESNAPTIYRELDAAVLGQLFQERRGVARRYVWDQLVSAGYSFKLDGIAYARDLTVSGYMKWDQIAGVVSGTFKFAGVASAGRISVIWNEREAAAIARIAGAIDDKAVAATCPRAVTSDAPVGRLEVDVDEEAVTRLLIAPISAAVDEAMSMPDLAFTESMRVALRHLPMLHHHSAVVMSVIVVTMVLGEGRRGAR